jgi:hypothetical protein
MREPKLKKEKKNPSSGPVRCRVASHAMANRPAPPLTVLAIAINAFAFIAC